jgi:hypothetical protein
VSVAGKPEPVLRCDPTRNVIATPFIQAQVLRIQQKLRKGKFSDAENKKQLRLTISTSNFVSLMGYTGVVGTAADEIKIWVPRNFLPAAILESPTLVSRASMSKRKRSSDNDGGASTSKRKRCGNNDGRASTSKGKRSGNDSGSSGEGTVTSKGAVRHMNNRSTMGPGPASCEVIEISSSSDDDERLRNHQSTAKGWLGFLDLTTPEPEEGRIQTKIRGT